VVLQVKIIELGRATDISVTRGVLLGMNESAIKTVSQWKFRPGTVDEKPIATLVPIEVNCRLF